LPFVGEVDDVGIAVKHLPVPAIELVVSCFDILESFVDGGNFLRTKLGSRKQGSERSQCQNSGEKAREPG
jgi:hypothetical protein